MQRIKSRGASLLTPRFSTLELALALAVSSCLDLVFAWLQLR